MVEDLEAILTEKTKDLETIGIQLEQAQNEMESILEQKNQLEKMLSVTEKDYNSMLEKKQHTLGHVDELERKGK